MQQAQAQQADSALNTVQRLWKRRRWLAIGVFAVTFAAAASFVFSLPDIYSSSATVLVNNVNNGQDPGPNGQGTGSDSRLDAVSEEVLSRDRLLDMINRFDLYPSLRQHASTDSLLGRMRQDIRVERKAGPQQWGQDPTFAFTLSYQGWDPQTVSKVTNALATSYVDANNKMRAQQAQALLTSLQTQMGDVKKKLDAQEAKINAFRSAHVGDLPEQQMANLAMLQQLSGQLHENNEALSQALQRRDSPASFGGTVSPDTAGSDLPQLEQQLTALRTRYTDAYPDVVQLKSQIAALKRQQADRAAAATRNNPIQADMDGTIYSYRQEESRLRAQMAQYQNRVENMPVRSQQLQSLMQGYGETQDVYSSLLRRYESAPLPGAVAGQYRVLEQAVPPTDASGPGRLKLLLMCLVLCLGLAGAVVFAAEQLDPSFHSVDELKAYTRVPILASIPLIITPDDIWRGRVRFGVAVLSAVVVAVILAQLSSLLGHGNQDLVWMLSRHGTTPS
jgi:polysaccharide chain length determinant protein (PEP-CTERM system associated)